MEPGAIGAAASTEEALAGGRRRGMTGGTAVAVGLLFITPAHMLALMKSPYSLRVLLAAWRTFLSPTFCTVIPCLFLPAIIMPSFTG